MSVGYQKRDYHIIDYKLFNVKGIHRPLRGGAKFDPWDDYVAFVGAAQTFGCYVEKPFPTLLADHFGISVLNLGVAGAGPSFFFKKNFLAWINRARFIVLQVMSGRSVSNSIFQSMGGEILVDRRSGFKAGAQPQYERFIKENENVVIESLVKETRNNWIRDYLILLSQIKVPVILLWFSVRPPDYVIEDFGNIRSVFNDFPQMVQGDMVNTINGKCYDYVEVVSSRGMPQTLIDRFDGMPTKIKMRTDLGGKFKMFNDYYPSPEMHEDAFSKLRGIVASKIISSSFNYPDEI